MKLAPGQLHFRGFEGTDLPGDLADLIQAGRVGGVVLFSRNLGEPEQVAGLVAALHRAAPPDAPLTVAVDQEGGRVQRLRAPWTEWPAMRRLGERDSVDATRAVATALARELSDLGFDLDFAPCVDVDTHDANPVIGDRSFAADPTVVSRHAAAFVEELQRGGVAGCAKHFPGHGDTSVDSHLDLPRLRHDLERLRRVELPPFEAAVRAGVASVLTAHVVFEGVDGELPATFSGPVMRLLREEVGFGGLVFSDDLDMGAVAARFGPEEMVSRGLGASLDVFLACRDPDRANGVLAALERAPGDALRASLARLARFKGRHAGGRPARPRRPGRPPYPEHLVLAEELATPPAGTG